MPNEIKCGTVLPSNLQDISGTNYYGKNINNGNYFNGIINSQGMISSDVESSLNSQELSPGFEVSPYTMTTINAAYHASLLSVSVQPYGININDPSLLQTSHTILTLTYPESVFCPESSFQPTLVSNGYYTVSTYDKVGTYSSTSSVRTDQVLCPIGSYCLNGVSNNPSNNLK